MRYFFLLLCLFTTLSSHAQSTDQSARLQQLINRFDDTYYEFNLPGLVLDFRVNLAEELKAGYVPAQYDFFSGLLADLEAIETGQLSIEDQIDYGILYFECQLNLERLRLLRQTPFDGEVSDLEKLYDFDLGPQWYAWYVKKWTGSPLSPEEIMAFGHREIARVSDEIKKLALTEEKPAHYLTRDRQLIIETLKEKRDHINTILPRLMPDFESLPMLGIRQGTNTRLAQAPGYYSGNTFYFNLFDKPFDLADCDWMLIHEGSPGHHFQVNYHQQPPKPYRRGLRYPGFVEGWAAYTENLGWEMGLYQNGYEALGKWNWDLIRSVRVVLDVGLNYQGWTDEQALAFWQKHIQEQDDIAWREINRMKQWPAQVLTYKLGEAVIRDLLYQEKVNKGETFSFKTFHTALLSAGTVPMDVLPKLLN